MQALRFKSLTAISLACLFNALTAKAQVSTTPTAKPCPAEVAQGSQCVAGVDTAGAHYWLVKPPNWNGTLVVHAHGGPELGTPKPERATEDATRWAIWSRAGYAYAGSGFRQGGVAVRSAAEDTERVRTLFVAQWGPPKVTVLHGQSWGAGVAARTAEIFNTPINSKPPYDAVLLTSGVLGGGSQSYNFRLDLRVVYQAVCNNHPKPDEAAYPLWQGLPVNNTLTRAELATRVDACTGIRQKSADRTPAQQRNLKTILDVIRIPESSLLGHMNWATWHFQDIVFNRLNGRNPFGNDRVRYLGSPDDTALNTQVARYTADPAALKDFSADTDPQGRINVPVLTMHGINDAVAFVELESTFKDTMTNGGSAARLVQVFTRDDNHSYTSDAQYVTAMRALLDWVASGNRPTPASIASQCAVVATNFEATTGCRFLPEFQPQPLASRVPPR
jgi:pimeloyl-ACP methyl ester carboxylesterase